MDAPETTAKRPELEDWSVESEIGSGGCGTVYVVRNRHTGERAALKVPDPGSGWGEGTTAEIAALAAMRHQHIVDLVGTVPTDRGEGILMEYLPGGSVADLISARGPLGLGEVVTVLAPIAGALAFLHDHGGVHGDVAPGNVLFTAAGMPKLADLGLAVLVGGRQTDSGTPGFRAPVPDDDDDGGKRLRPARDVYSLAALAWYMVTGRIAGPTYQRPPLSSLLGGVPGNLVELLEDGLAEDESRRPSAAEFSRRIFEAAKPLPVNLRDAVRPEALAHMVTHVVADPVSRKDRRGPWGWMRGLVPRREGGNRRVPPRPRRRGAHGRRGASGARGWQQSALWIAATAAVVVAVVGIIGGNVSLRGQPDAPPAVAEVAGAETAGRASPPPTPVRSPRLEPEAPAGPAPGVVEDAAFRAPVPADPLDAAAVLAARRDLALASADATALRHVHAGNGASLGPDLATASQLRAQGLHYAGLKTTLSDARLRAGAARNMVDVAVTSTISPYRVIGADGTTVATVEKPDVQRVTLRLARADGGWLIAGVLDSTADGKEDP